MFPGRRLRHCRFSTASLLPRSFDTPTSKPHEGTQSPPPPGLLFRWCQCCWGRRRLTGYPVFPTPPSGLGHARDVYGEALVLVQRPRQRHTWWEHGEGGSELEEYLVVDKIQFGLIRPVSNLFLIIRAMKDHCCDHASCILLVLRVVTSLTIEDMELGAMVEDQGG